MQIYYPALITSAIFFGAIVVNLHDRNYSTVIFTSLLAIPTLLLLVLLSQKNLDIIAYLLILVPFILVFVGYSLGVQNQGMINMQHMEHMEPIESIESNNNVVPERLETHKEIV